MTYQPYTYYPYPYQPDVAERIEVTVVARQVRYRWVPDAHGVWGWQPLPVADERYAASLEQSARAVPTAPPARPIRTIYVTNAPDSFDMPDDHMVEGTLTELGS